MCLFFVFGDVSALIRTVPTSSEESDSDRSLIKTPMNLVLKN